MTKEKLNFNNKRRFFMIKNLDSHLNIQLFGKIKLCIKIKKYFKYEPAAYYGLNSERRMPQLIVSLTSYPERIQTVCKPINTLLRQSVKPDRLILWLAEEEFSDKEAELPSSLLSLKDLGLEIKWCKDLKSYKKLIPALYEFPNDIIVTADDDIYYQKDWLESLYNAYLKDPNKIYTKRADYISVNDNDINIYGHVANNRYISSYGNKMLGGAGTLYPPKTLYKDVLDENLIKTLIPTHDDIYFWAMAVLAGTQIVLVKCKDADICQLEETRKTGLCKINNDANGNSPNQALQKIFDRYPQILDLLRKKQ